LRIADLYKWEKPVLSLEVFPPKPEHSLSTVFRTLDGLRDLKPSFVSVTYGSAGDTVERTVKIASRVRDEYGCESLAHVTCIGHTTGEIDLLLNRLESLGISNVLALRGDIPEGEEPPSRDFDHASQLVAHIKRRSGFCIGAAAYPEGHFESSRVSADLKRLKEKVDAGAEFLISQLFFDNRVFYDFLERAEALGITVPVIPGIMPIQNYRQIKRILMMCRVSVPASLLSMFDRYAGDPESLAAAGVEYATSQVADLMENGAGGIHLYTMNRVKQIRQIVGDSGLRKLEND